MWKLEIHDSGDPSVGIFSQTWFVDVPFTFEFDNNKDDENAIWFKEQIENIFETYCEGKMTTRFIQKLDNKIHIAHNTASIINIS